MSKQECFFDVSLAELSDTTIDISIFHSSHLLLVFLLAQPIDATLVEQLLHSTDDDVIVLSDNNSSDRLMHLISYYTMRFTL